jgi:uncharacterized membrane protein YphA (DoxX/SURF4 family)
MFSMFPDGWPGAGLLLLRTAAGAGLIAQGIAYFEDGREMGLPTIAVAVFAIAVGALLLTGCLTRFAAAVAVVGGMLSVFFRETTPHFGLFETPTTSALAIVIAAALICLGPGAFSVDASLFGRREVIIPKNVHDTDA